MREGERGGGGSVTKGPSHHTEQLERENMMNDMSVL